VKKHKRKEAKKKKLEESKNSRVKSEEPSEKEKLHFSYQPHELPAFFDIAVEKRHLEHLSKNTLDRENRL